MFRGLSADIYFNVGLITIIGLSAKNAVLIIEFAKELQAQGKSAAQAVLEAAHLRFRPIVMTSMAFILGVVPLVIASGAGSAGQRAIGTGVMGGMLSATLLAVFFVPVFFVSVGVRLELSLPQLLADLPFVLSLLAVMLAAKLVSGLYLLGTGVRARHALAGALLLASPLTLVIAIADLATRAEAITGSQETAVVAAGMVASLLFPTLARLLLAEQRPAA